MKQILLVWCIWCISGVMYANPSEDSISIYQRSLEKIQGNKITLYKYGSFQPRTIEEAFLVFLTGDSLQLETFKKLDPKSAISFALSEESGVFRYDWGQDGFFLFSRYCIFHYKMYAPELQNKFALTNFHFWMNEKEFNSTKLASKYRRQERKLNAYWKKKYKHTSKHLDKAYDNIWKTDRKNRKAEKKSSHRHID